MTNENVLNIMNALKFCDKLTKIYLDFGYCGLSEYVMEITYP